MSLAGYYTKPDPSYFSYIVFDFIHAVAEPPDPISFCAQLAHIHRVAPPSEYFGFYGLIPICGEKGIPTSLGIDPDWPRFFSSLLRLLLKKDLSVNGHWQVYEQGFDKLIDRVIPQLLGHLQSDSLKPTLVHGNLSDGNIAVDAITGMPVIFSPCALYAHHEFELGISRVPTLGLDEDYIDHYMKFIKPSHPREEFRDRVKLYGIRFNLEYSISGRNAAARDRILQDMQYLNARYETSQ